jgi:hypothetical protein
VTAALFESNFSGSPTNYSMFTFGGGIYSYNNTLPAGTFYWLSYASDAATNRNASDRVLFTISKATNLMTLLLNDTFQNVSCQYPCTANITGINTNATIWRNNTNVSSENRTAVELAAGYYEYTLNVSGTQNYTANTTRLYLSITKGVTLTRLFLNDTEGNKEYSTGQLANFTVTVNASGQTVYLDTNITGWVTNTTATPLMNLTTLNDVGVFNITGYYLDTQNYSDGSVTYYATVITGANNPPLYLVNGSNTSEPPAFTAVLLYANWTDDTGLANATLATNETGAWENKSTAAIDASGWSNFTWQNDSLDGDTLVAWRIYANDTAGNENVTETGEFKVGSSVSITLVKTSAELGSLAPGDENSTSGDVATPFELRNDGNVKVNITVNGTSLFNETANPTANYRYAANESTEGVTYTSACSDTAWTNMPALNAPRLFLCYLGWITSADQAEVEIAVAVPASEPTGAKSSMVTFIASQA